ncbi:hypothetical protein ACFQU3_15550 [Terrabacter sp. GCM10028922]|uniref:hypothetical protein n=1 Tax=Terrabacter sp. GCM10028922 TaxID=3273428 RepID=UPI00360CDCBE
MAAFAVAVAAAAIWRARYGLDLSDSSHAVELAMRLAQGDVPFRDEMNLQALGAWPAAPFTWVWLHLVGLDGIVLASRVWFVVVSAAVGAGAWLALRRAFGRGTTACALAVALVPAAYNQQVLSYNTTPALMYLLAASAGVGAVTRCARCRRPYAVLAGAAAALGAVSHPVTAPAAAVLLVLLVTMLWRRDSAEGLRQAPPGIRGRLARRPGVTAVMAGVVAVVLVVAVLWVGVWGPANVSETLAFTDAYQATRPSRTDRLGRWATQLGEALTGPWVLTAMWLGVLAAFPAMRRLRAPLLVVAVLAVGVQAAQGGASASTYTVLSWLTPLAGSVVVAVLVPVLVVASVRDRRPVGRLAALGLAPTLVGMPLVAAFTSSAPVWGATGAALAPGLLAASLGALVWVRSRAGKLLVAATLLLCLGTLHVLGSYRDGPPGSLVVAAPDGAFAGLLTTPERSEEVLAGQQALRACAAPGDGVLDYIHPAAFLYADVRFDTPIVWMDYFGSTSRYVLDWVERTGRAPECVVAARDYWPGHGRSRYIAGPDPLRDWVVAHYRVVSQTSQLVVLRHTG